MRCKKRYNFVIKFKMDLSRLSAELKYVEINGVTLNIDERTRIDLGCMELANSIKTNKMYFWGKIRGKSIRIDRYLEISYFTFVSPFRKLTILNS